MASSAEPRASYAEGQTKKLTLPSCPSCPPCDTLCGSSRPRILLLAMLPIGDTLFLTPTIRALRDRFPQARIVALARHSNAPIVRCVPEVDEVRLLPLLADWAGAGPLAGILRELRGERFEVAVDFTSPAYKWISLCSGIPVRTYLKLDPGWWFLPGKHARWGAAHATRHYYDSVRELDLPPWSQVSHQPRIVLTSQARRTALAFLRRQGLWPGRGPLVALHPGGAGLGGVKRWPPERFACVAEHLRRENGAYILLLGGPEDRPLAQTIATQVVDPPPVVATELPLLTTAALIERCDLFIGNDSGLLHLAAALGTSYVGIYGPTSLDNFRPIAVRPGQGRLALPAWPCFTPRHFVGGDHALRGPCCERTCAALETISPAQVIAHADALLAERCARDVSAASTLSLKSGRSATEDLIATPR
jgi:lipopolysaccharide heptosyltransferase II